MEDGDINCTGVPAMLDVRVLLTKMANYPDVELTVIKGKKSTDCKHSESSTKINGESEKIHSDDQDDYTSDEDTLIIDEEYKKDTQPNASKKRARSPSPRANFKGFKKRIIEKSLSYLKTTNDLKKTLFIDEKETAVDHDKCDKNGESCAQGEFNKTETITQTGKTSINNKQGTGESCTLINTNSKFSHTSLGDASNRTESPKRKVSVKQPVKKRPSQKLTEYAQYLGLQPAVKFKCVKCSESSFPSLSALNDHQRHCLVQPHTPAKSTPPTSTVPTSSPLTTNFRVTRKVFLCSSCGTYYENCNLFLHMREVHRRYICLYCLGMFSMPEKLSLHLIAKHHCSPSRYGSAEEFLNSYMEPCYLVCCHCERVFSEQDNFFEHVCLDKPQCSTEKPCWSCGVKGTTAHTASCKLEQPSTSNTLKPNNKSTAHKASLKQNKPVKNNSKSTTSHIQHVTADSPSTSSVAPETEMDITRSEIQHTDTNQLNEQIEIPVKSPPPVENNINSNDTITISSPLTKITSPTIKLEVDESPQKETSNLEEIENKTDTDLPTSEPIETALEIKSESEEIPNIIEGNNSSIVVNNLPADSDHSSVELVESNADENHSDVEPTEENMDTSIVDSHEANVSQSNSESENVKDTSSVLSVHDTDDENVIDDYPDNKESENEDEPVKQAVEPVEETRKVPKVTLKIPPPGSIVYNSDNESDDSEKLTMEVEENGDSDVDCDESQDNSKPQIDTEENHVNGIDNNETELTGDESLDEFPVAGNEVPIVELELDIPLDKFDSRELLKTCLGATIPTCVYCNHARKIAVNGKQLGLHSIAEHRFAATVNSITAEELIPKSFNSRIKECLDELDSVFFSLDEQIKQENDIKEENSVVTSFKRVYECFQCRYVTTIHKELYLHNRKMHAKTILLCIMCKSNFYSYSELICHLCPGNYVLNSETKFRCCMCSFNELPSAFRLMVHLRKRHHTCDVCLEGCNNQSKLSNHVWKHKLHHLCYRCGIAYRNKPDITKHLFWKHGTESVLCKRCLQKKWPHVYHFCIPPISFLCEECNLSFSKAVYLKVHKRLHINEKPHACTEENCSETFISKKLQLKHEIRHREPIPIEKSDSADENKENIEVEKLDNPENTSTPNDNPSSETVKSESTDKCSNSTEKEEANSKKIIDVYDFPALNLSESDSDDSEDEKSKLNATTPQLESKINETSLSKTDAPMEVETSKDEEHKSIPILDGIWDNFKNYQATIGKCDTVSSTDVTNTADNIVKEEPKVEEPDIEVIMAEHDYCVSQNASTETNDKVDIKADENTGMDHDYCTVSKKENTADIKEPKEEKIVDNVEKKKVKSSKKKASKHNGSSSSSDSSSDSGSSSCTCGSNCSCSSSSGSSSSSSTSSDSDTSSSEGKRRILARRERRKERANKRKKESETSQTSAVDVVANEDTFVPIPIPELPILESDLDTDETETDEDFYDEHPQRLANKILAEKRNQLALLAAVAPVNNGTILECSRPSTPSMPEPEQHVVKKKAKSKKRKKKSRSSTPKHNIPAYNHHRQPTMQPVLPSTPVYQQTVPPINIINSVVTTHIFDTPKHHHQSTGGSGSETDSNVRSSKRRRVPNKFYGYSSDEEREKLRQIPLLKWRKADLPSVPSTHVTGSPKMVPPLTIKNIPSPAPVIEPIRAPVIHHNEVPESDSDVEEVVQNRKSTSDSSESNHNDDSDSDTGQLHISQPPVYHPPPVAHHSGMQGHRSNENLYCYCQCPYDEVSEMIACDGKDCAIEWFHFECVGIMVPPKGKWFCPDCRKKATGRGDFIQI